MLPDETKILKPVLTLIKNPKNKESLRLLFLLSVCLFLIISPGAAAASSSWEFIPENPAVGDIMEIKGNGFEGETAKVVVTFEKEVEVQDGKYEYILENVVIPSGFDNSFTVQAEGVEDLNVRAKMLLWLTKSAEAKDGTATVSQKTVPPGTYQIRIDGKSTGSEVKLKIKAMQEIEVDSEGSLSYQYNTKSIPAGDFEVKVGDITKQIKLQPSETTSSGINSRDIKAEETNEKKTGKTTDGVNEEKVKEKNTSNEKKFIGSSFDTKSKKVWIAGILVGLILFLVYLKIRKS
ncbi:hypothetical protein [Methanosarcina sp. UBA289]|uniref:hypothetical protein n=1 Tax=Methanosarcina sp. UBA289 TaxID=1915574 RepID=UPI0025D33C33|nr:hypothetical protein [Methanosarcina sp. UBA289]